jgi:hypothetical protein
MGLFRRKKKAVVVEKTATQKINAEIKTYTTTVDKLERLKPRLNKLITHYKKQLQLHTHVYGHGITLTFIKGDGYPDGFYAFADKLGLNIEPICSNNSYGSNEEKSFVVRAKSK